MNSEQHRHQPVHDFFTEQEKDQKCYFIVYEWIEIISPLSPIAAGIDVPKGQQLQRRGTGQTITTMHPLEWMMQEWKRREISISLIFWDEIPMDVGIKTKKFLNEMKEKAQQGLSMK